MENANKKKKKSKKKVFRNLIFVLVGISLLSLGMIYFLNMVPFNYFLGIIVLILGFDIFISYLILGHGWKKRLLGTILSILMIIGMCCVDSYALKTIDFLNKINKNGNYNTENYSLIVLKDNNYDKLKNLQNKTVGIVKLGEDKGLEEAKKQLSKKIEVEYQEKEDLTTLFLELQKETTDAILIEDAEKKMIEEEHPEFLNLEQVIYTFSVDIEIKDELAKNVDILDKPFNIYISGIDSYGKITSVSRSDVNMVVSINPVTHKILLTSIPRDYYVKLNGIDTEYKDKLTHAGMHGIDTSIKTIEDLLEIDINYYVKVNFTSLVDLVDELDGIDVELDKPFRAYYEENGKMVNYAFKKGVNHLNGKQALAFARERKSLTLGDRARVEHQQMIMEGLMHKVLSKSIISKYSDILSSLEGKFITNFGTQNISKLVKNQLKENPNWEITRNVLTGTDSHEYTYSYKQSKAYVMMPIEESVIEAKNLIKTIFEEIPANE